MKRLVTTMILATGLALAGSVAPAQGRPVPSHACAIRHDCPPVYLMGHPVTVHRVAQMCCTLYVQWSGTTFITRHRWHVPCPYARNRAVLDAWQGKLHRQLWAYVYACGTTWKEPLTG